VNPKNETVKEGTLCRKGNCEWRREDIRKSSVSLQWSDCEAAKNIVALARELHVSRRQLYRWRDELDPEIAGMEVPGQNARTSTLRKEVNHLKRVLAEKTLEVDFFRSPCKKSRLIRRAANDRGVAKGVQRRKSAQLVGLSDATRIFPVEPWKRRRYTRLGKRLGIRFRRFPLIHRSGDGCGK
jgi:Transposase